MTKNTLSEILKESKAATNTNKGLAHSAPILPQDTEAAPTETAPTETEPTDSALKLPSKKTLQAIGGLSATAALVSTAAGHGPIAAMATAVFGTVAIAQNFAEDDSHD